jgi:hypothetical protein
MTTDGSRKRLPPYVSYRTFHNFVDRLQQQGIPLRIDRSYWGDILSGSTGPQLMAAMRFLDLVDTNGKPTPRLGALVPADGEKRAQLIRSIANQSFSFVIKSSLDLANATYSQLEECFDDNFSLADDVKRKCVKFFIAMAGDAGIPISTYIIKHTRSGHNGSGAKNGGKKSVPKNIPDEEDIPQGKHVPQTRKVPQEMEQLPDKDLLLTKLLDKFPEFNPSWNDDLKLRWIGTFDELFTRIKTKEQERGG